MFVVGLIVMVWKLVSLDGTDTKVQASMAVVTLSAYEMRRSSSCYPHARVHNSIISRFRLRTVPLSAGRGMMQSFIWASKSAGMLLVWSGGSHVLQGWQVDGCCVEMSLEFD